MNLAMGAHAAKPGRAFQLPWFAIAIGALAGVALGALAEGLWLQPGGQPAATLSQHWSVGAAWLLAIAAALYLVAHATWEQTLGTWASTLALLGASGLLAASLLRAIETSWLLPSAVFAEQFEAPSWIAAVAVLIYLRVEQRWHSRDAGAMVMLLVLAALWLDLWLMAWTAGLPVTLAQVVRAHLGWLWHVGGKLGVAACVFLGLWCLAGVAPRLRRWARHETGLRAAMSLGLAGFTLALLSAMALLVLPGDHLQAVGRFLSGAAVWLNFGALYLMWRRWRVIESEFALCVAMTLSLAVLGYFVGNALEHLL